MRSSSTIRSRRSMTALRRSAGNVLSGGLLADGGLRCGRGGFAVFGVGAEDVACSASFGCGLAAGGGELAPASAAGVVAGAGIVIVGFFATGVCFDDVDCAAAGASRRTGESGPAPGAGAASTLASGSAARACGRADSIRAEKTSSDMARRGPARRSSGDGGCGIAPPVLGAWFIIRVLAGNRPCAWVAGCDVMRARSTLGAVCHVNRG